MKALIHEDYKKLAYKKVPDPVINDDKVLVKVMACGICGSDAHNMKEIMGPGSDSRSK